MSREYYILLPDGSRTGPCAEEEILDLLESGDLSPEDRCVEAESGRIVPAGRLFRVIIPAPEERQGITPGPPVRFQPAPPAPSPSPPAPVPWQPAPFPAGEAKPARRARPRLLYRGTPSPLNYWRSTLLATLVFTGGAIVRHGYPDVFLLSQACGSLILLSAVLRMLRTQYYITSTCVAMHSGLIARSSRELPMADISAIHLERNGLAGLLGVGTLTFTSVRGPGHDVVFRRIWRASYWKRFVRRVQEGPPSQGRSAV